MQMPVDTHMVFLDFAVQFGTIAVFAAKNREPTPADFDFANVNANSADPQQVDYLSIVSCVNSMFTTMRRPMIKRYVVSDTLTVSRRRRCSILRTTDSMSS